MLTKEKAKKIQYKGTLKKELSKPQFRHKSSLWIKEETNTFQDGKPDKQDLFPFIKIGKTFGFEITRYIFYHQGFLFYYDNDDDDKHKGYCRLENIYLYFLQLEERFFLYLTNGTQSSEFYFGKKDFMEKKREKIFQQVIQLNFYEKYFIVNELGKGSFANVFLAKRKKNMKQEYAVKIINKKDKYGQNTKSIVEQEKRILSILNSKYICKFYQFFQEEDSFVFVLQLIKGKQLMIHLREKEDPFTFKEAHMILKTLLKGLDDCHANGVIHRDLKPQNVILNPQTLEPKIIDFGLSLYCHSKVEMKKFKRCGTMGYMAYQVIQNTPEKFKPYDQKCDMFSFGVIMHMVLMGTNPVKGKNYEETLKKNTEWNFKVKKHQIISKYGESCYIILNSLLEKDPEKRFSAQQVLESSFFSQDPTSLQNIKFSVETCEKDSIELQDQHGLSKKLQKVQSLRFKSKNFCNDH